MHYIIVAACHAGDRGSIPRDGVCTIGLVAKPNVAIVGPPVDSGIVHNTTNSNSDYYLFGLHQFHLVVVQYTIRFDYHRCGSLIERYF